MTPERAKEILRAGSQWGNYSTHCTAEENAEVLALWNTMPGSTCWYDALVRISRGETAPPARADCAHCDATDVVLYEWLDVDADRVLQLCLDCRRKVT